METCFYADQEATCAAPAATNLYHAVLFSQCSTALFDQHHYPSLASPAKPSHEVVQRAFVPELDMSIVGTYTAPEGINAPMYATDQG